MTKEERNKLIKFCGEARCEIEGIEDPLEVQHVTDSYRNYSDEKLEQEADFLDDMLGK